MILPMLALPSPTNLRSTVRYSLLKSKMARKQKQKGQKTPNFSLHAKPNGSSKGKKLESYEDTLEPGSTDERE
jgi:hypothetical protein